MSWKCQKFVITRTKVCQRRRDQISILNFPNSICIRFLLMARKICTSCGVHYWSFTLWDLGRMLRLKVNFEWVLIACNIGTKLTRLFSRHSAFVFQMTKEISTVVVRLEALWTLVRLLIGWCWLVIVICKRKRVRLVWIIKVFESFPFHMKQSEK